MEKKYIVKPYLSIRKVKGNLNIGTLPPVGIVIEDYPDYLIKLLDYLSVQHTKKEILDFISQTGSLTLSESELVFYDLKESGIISEFDYKKNERYSRHRLYYDLISETSKNYQEELAKKTVGLIGMGGIGSNIAMNLVAAGIGRFVISDGDIIEESNLTRQYLYRESDIGKFKVDVAKERLKDLNSEVDVIPIRETVSGADFFYKNKELSECDFIVISADSPAKIHDWINDASVDLGFPYSNAGYIEKYGIVGPLVIPGKTACYECYKFTEYSENINQLEYEEQGEELNRNIQAPSYGPLNSLVASIQSNEVIRYLLQFETKTESRRLLIDSENYRIYEEEVSRRSSCKTCSFISTEVKEEMQDESSLVEIYSENASSNLNDTVLNPFMIKLMEEYSRGELLEIGSATGKLGLSLRNKGFNVDFNDISNEMLNRIPVDDSSKFLGDFTSLNFNKKYAYVICNNVLDYVKDIDSALKKLHELVSPDGYLFLTLPHPIKGNGCWKKSKYNGRWHYETYEISNYFDEGEVYKEREDSSGNIILSQIKTHHRTLETYFNAIINTGFNIEAVYEVKGERYLEETEEILFEKSSKIPYFLTLKLTLSKQ